MITIKRRRGDIGEKKALEFLEKRGYKLLYKNYQNRFGEIDIICKKNNNLHFIEVKTSFSNFDPAENMTKDKMLKILRTANYFLMQSNLPELSIYFDLVSVNFKKKRISIYPNINNDLID